MSEVFASVWLDYDDSGQVFVGDVRVTTKDWKEKRWIKRYNTPIKEVLIGFTDGFMVAWPELFEKAVRVVKSLDVNECEIDRIIFNAYTSKVSTGFWRPSKTLHTWRRGESLPSGYVDESIDYSNILSL